MGRRKVVSLFVSNISQDFCKIDLPADPGMEKVSQEEVNFDNLSEYSSAFPRYSYFIKGLDNTFIDLENLVAKLCMSDSQRFLSELIPHSFVWGQPEPRQVLRDL